MWFYNKRNSDFLNYVDNRLYEGDAYDHHKWDKAEGRDTRFDSIRCFYDEEISDVLKSIFKNNRHFPMYVIYAFLRWPSFYSIAKFIPIIPIINVIPILLSKFLLKRAFSNVTTVYDFNLVFAKYVTLSILNSIFSGSSFSGLKENLDRDKTYLYISNHRDIVLDPGFLSIICFSCGYGAVDMAIGDNLLFDKNIRKFILLFRSFIIQRNITGNKELFLSLKLVSDYMRMRYQKRKSIWIAQSDGRAKDWCDKTHVALLKMIYLAWNKECSFSEMLQKVNIVPVAISYEYLPADKDFAKELRAIDEKGFYNKKENDDIKSMKEGLLGFKGHLHYHFGKVAPATIKTPKDLADYIDQQIYLGYKIYSCNLMAYKMHMKNLEKKVNYSKLRMYLKVEESDFYDKKFQKRIDKLPSADIPYVLSMYAQPVILRLGALEKEAS